MKILIVKLGAIGDVVHTLPTLAAIRRHLPDARIGWAVEEKSASILRGNVLIDDLIELDTRSMRDGPIDNLLIAAGRQIGILRNFEFDVAIDFQGLFKSAALTKFSRSTRTVGFSKSALREPGSRFLLSETVDVEAGIHVIDKNLSLASGALGIDLSDGPVEFPIATEDLNRIEAQNVAELAGGPFAIINPAGGWPTKLWDAAKFGRLADRLSEEFGLRSVITTAPGESDLAMRTLEAAKIPEMIVTAEPTLKGFYELAKLARIYVGGDTGPTHIAVAAACPVVGIFGPTEWWRNGSPRKDDICVERTDISCRIDCHRRSCDKWICMDIDVETVAGAVRRRLEAARG